MGDMAEDYENRALDEMDEALYGKTRNGHVLKRCDCGERSCSICEWDADICAVCGAAEIELQQPCKGATP